MTNKDKNIKIKTSKTQLRKILKIFDLQYLGKYDISISIIEDREKRIKRGEQNE